MDDRYFLDGGKRFTHQIKFFTEETTDLPCILKNSTEVAYVATNFDHLWFSGNRKEHMDVDMTDCRTRRNDSKFTFI